MGQFEKCPRNKSLGETALPVAGHRRIVALIREIVAFKIATPVAGITNRYCTPSFETATEPVIGPRGACHRARIRATCWRGPVGGLLQRRAQLRSRGDEV